MEKIFLFNVEPDVEAVIAKCAGNMHIKVGIIPAEMHTETLEKIVGGRTGASGAVRDSGDDGSKEPSGKSLMPFSKEPSGKSLMLFCEVTEKHLDRVLGQLRLSSKNVDYKAMLTPTNQKWTLKKLMLELECEKISMAGLT